MRFGSGTLKREPVIAPARVAVSPARPVVVTAILQQQKHEHHLIDVFRATAVFEHEYKHEQSENVVLHVVRLRQQCICDFGVYGATAIAENLDYSRRADALALNDAGDFVFGIMTDSK